MQYYQEITVLPDPEISAHFIWQKLYTLLHKKLVDIKNQQAEDSIGVSFPQYKYEDRRGRVFSSLGNKLRVFSLNEANLAELNLNGLFANLDDYIHVKGIKPVPEGVDNFVCVSRYRYKNVEKQAKEFALFKSVDYEDALNHCKEYKRGSRKNYPFINVESATTGQVFQLSIKQEVCEHLVAGAFNTYGINAKGQRATVPHW